MSNFQSGHISAMVWSADFSKSDLQCFRCCLDGPKSVNKTNLFLRICFHSVLAPRIPYRRYLITHSLTEGRSLGTISAICTAAIKICCDSAIFSSAFCCDSFAIVSSDFCGGRFTCSMAAFSFFFFVPPASGKLPAVAPSRPSVPSAYFVQKKSDLRKCSKKNCEKMRKVMYKKKK